MAIHLWQIHWSRHLLLALFLYQQPPSLVTPPSSLLTRRHRSPDSNLALNASLSLSISTMKASRRHMMRVWWIIVGSKMHLMLPVAIFHSH
ncbi:hypothetical protein Golob_026503, partial [Gossypium lobatum]|nr:hypothetical protein [Gossypium lobatum]